MKQGRIVKGIAGFYYVDVEGDGVYACKAKGLFRKEGVKPLVGDLVRMEVTDPADREGNVTEILPRKCTLLRPAVSNVDQALVIFSLHQPEPNSNLLDRFLLRMAVQGLPVILALNKRDLATEAELISMESTYGGAGCQVILTCGKTGEGIKELKALLHRKMTTVAGPSGVGKSTIVNCLQSRVSMETGDVSKKIERGKHTTRHSELISLGDGGYILDTPGFSSLLLPEIGKEELSSYYPEFQPFLPRCRFSQCSHLAEPGCAVKDALEAGHIPPTRYENYRLFYEELKERKGFA